MSDTKRILELTIIITPTGIFLTSVDRKDDNMVTSNTYINRKYDSIRIDISPLPDDEKNKKDD